MSEPSHLHEDDPAATWTDPVTGRRIRNLNAAEYESSYEDPEAGPHPSIPDDILSQSLEEARAEFPDEPEQVE